MRIVSLLPSTTEILFAIGAGDDVVGVTFECDFPDEARSRRIVSTSAMPEGLTPAEIDVYVVGAVSRGEDLYHLSADALAELDADLVVTQDLCAVCAVDVSVVDDALAYLGCRAEVLTIDPHTLDEVFDSIVFLGRATGHEAEATALVGGLRTRLEAVRSRVAGLPRPRVMLLEWTDPPYAPGHWVPEMISAAGGEPLLGRPGAKSERVPWESVHEAAPDIIVCAPCGYDLPGAQRLADDLVASGVLPPGVPVHAVDANAAWARPGTRLVDGVEELAAILHPAAPEPAPRECVACYVARMLADRPCDGTLRWATAFRDHSSPTATGLERRLVDAGGTCDCALLSHGYRLARHLMVRDLATDELEPPAERPVCAGVGRTSSRPCANWERRR